MEKGRLILSSVLEYIAIGVVFLYAFSGAFHEYVHLTVLELLGGEGYIIKGETVVIVHSSNDALMAMSGGFVTALVLMFIAYLAWRQDYLEMYAAAIPLIIVELIYGSYETFCWYLPAEEYWILGRPVSIFALAIGLIISVYTLYKGLIRRVKS